MPDEPLTISVREACRLLGVGRDEGYRMVADGRLPALRVGHRFRIPRAAVGRLIEALCADQRLPAQAAAPLAAASREAGALAEPATTWPPAGGRFGRPPRRVRTR